MTSAAPRRACAWVLAGLLVLPAVAQAQRLRLESCTIRADITGRLATTTIEKVYVNSAAQDQEVFFRFQLPERAAVHDLAMWIGGVRSPAVLYPRATAGQIYREIVSQRRDPALLEYLGGGEYRLRVFPVPANGSQKVEIVLTHLMPVQDKRVVYQSPRIVESIGTAGAMDFSARVRCPGGLKDLRPESDRMGVYAVGDGSLQVGFRARGRALTQRIALSFEPGQAPQRVLTWRDRAGTLRFWAAVSAEDALLAGRLRKRTFVLVLDVSASMSGWRMKSLRATADRLLARMSPIDQFAIVAAASDVRLWRAKPAAATNVNLALARKYLAGLAAGGGTDLAAALRAAETFNVDKTRPCYVLAVTDADDLIGARGLPVAAKLPDDGRPAVQPAENLQLHWFLTGWETISPRHMIPTRRGEIWYVDRPDSVRFAVTGFFDQAARPGITDLAASVSAEAAMKVRDVQHTPPRWGRGLVVTGQYAKGGTLTVRLSARIDGVKETWDFKLPVPDAPRGADVQWVGPNVQKLWDHLVCEQLWEQLQEPGAPVQVLERLVAISRTRRVVTRATAMLVLESEDDYIRRGIEPPGAVLSRRLGLSAFRRGQAVERAIRAKTSKEIALLLDRAKTLRAKGDLALAAGALEEVKRLDSRQFAACLEASILREYLAVQSAARWARRRARTGKRIVRGAWHEVLQPVSVVSLIPAPGLKRPLPPSRPFPALPGEAEQLLRRLTMQKVDKLDFSDSRLKDVIAYLQVVTNLNIQVKWNALQVAGVDKSTAVNVRGRDLTVAKALDMILDDLGGGGTPLGFIVDKGVITISTKEDLSRKTYLLIYDVRDLLFEAGVPRGMLTRALERRWDFFGDEWTEDEPPATAVRLGELMAVRLPTRQEVRIAESPTGRSTPPPSRPGRPGRPAPRGAMFDDEGPARGADRGEDRLEEELRARPERVNDLIQLARETIDPTSWRSAGGEVGSIREFGGLLIVQQTWDSHLAIRRLLERLRDHKPAEQRPVTPTQTTVEHPEALFTPQARLTPWPLALLQRAREGKLSRFSSVVVRKVGKRSFARIGGIWLDTALTKRSQVRLVCRDEAAADALLKARSDLKPCFALGLSVIVALDGRQAVSLDDVGLKDAADPKLRPLLPAPKR